MKRQERERPTLLAQTRYLGTLGLLLALPIVFGAYAGLWYDRHQAGYSALGTVMGLFCGVVVGFINVYLFVRGTV
ncbi:MAG: AtpZ/AtpI family protein [Candidatus Eremiobacteraeota bacterium]|nr:AtpZ/AtpI family protein [Candidatus Eremiobacteraeota bacterium]